MGHENRLARETSPYLLQPAHNPVDGYPWSKEAFQKARREKKPILLSVGYSACHWCHVMERESFENEAIAGLMNARFVNVKVDREERRSCARVSRRAGQVCPAGAGCPFPFSPPPAAKLFYGGTSSPP